MAAKKTFSSEALLTMLRNLPQPQRYWLAYSGGLDSSVLLQALAQVRPLLPAPLSVVHVDHGLHEASAHWAEYCKSQCADLALPLLTQRLQGIEKKGESLEARAREARYAVLEKVVGVNEMLLTAHHADDQVETFLLQWLRGSGAAGLAAMPPLRRWAQGWLARPLLGWGRAELEHWARAQKLRWLEDPSNALTDIRRNYLRHEVLPLLKRHWPGLLNTAGRSARHCAEVAELAEALAEQDLLPIMEADRLLLPRLQKLSRVRQKNVLRYWLRQQGLVQPGHQIIRRVLDEMSEASSSAAPVIDWPGGEIRRYRQHLYALPPLPPVPQAGLCLSWNTHQPLELPHNLGRLEVADWADIPQTVQVMFRSPGLKCALSGRQGRKPFKKLCQELAIPPWLRSRLPVIVNSNGQVIALADYSLCAPYTGKMPFIWRHSRRME